MKKVQIGNDQEMARSESNSHSITSGTADMCQTDKVIKE